MSDVNIQHVVLVTLLLSVRENAHV